MENIKTFFKKNNIDFFFPIAFILTIVPLIVRMKPVDSEESVIDLFGAKLAGSDLFSQRKAFILMIFCIILICITVIFAKKIFEKRDKTINIILIASIVFLLFTFLSTIFSDYKQTALWGIFDRAEGFVTVTCYVVLLIYSIYTFKNTTNYKFLITPILIVVFINSFLGLFQYVGQDLMKTNLAIDIVVPSQYQTGAKLDLSFGGRIYGTLFHYDFVGSFAAIVLPILFCLSVFEDEDIMHKITLIIGTLLSIWLLFGSTSRAGIVGVAGAAIFGAIIFWKLIIKRWKPLLICFISLLVILVGLSFVTKDNILHRIPSLASDAMSVFKDTSDFDFKDHIPVKDVKITDKDTQIFFQNETLKLSYENNNYVFRNSKDEVINFTPQNNNLVTSNEAFKNISFAFSKLTNTSTKLDVLILMIDNKPSFQFALRDGNKLHIINPNTKKDMNLIYPESFGFKGKEKLGSSRGYIWSRSIPLLKNDLIVGSGPDTFALQFPQGDFIGKIYAYETPYMIVDKPHNLYLQIAINYGVIALSAFLAIIIIYLVDSMRLYALKKDYNKSQVLGASICLGVIGYLFAGVFNDSVVSVAPVFWIALGVGIATNFINRTAPVKKRK